MNIQIPAMEIPTQARIFNPRGQVVMSQLYHLLYTIKAIPEGLATEDVPRETGACDDIVVLSIVLPPTGEYSQVYQAVKGSTKTAMPVKDVFKAWIMLAGQLMGQTDLDPGRQVFVEMVWNMWMKVLEESKNHPDFALEKEKP